MKKRVIRGILVLGLGVCAFSLQGCELSGSSYSYADDVKVIEVNNTVSEVVAKVENACVGIYSANSSTGATGSGVVYKKDGQKYYCITNYHVVEDFSTFRVYLSDSFSISAKLEATYPGNDLACLSFEAADKYDIGVIDIQSSEPKITVGETVIAIGCPLGLSNFNYVSVGVASSSIFSSTVNSKAVDIFYHDAAINSGNSGGALFNITGTLIGINFRKVVTDNEGYMVEGMGEAIYVGEVVDFLISNSLL